MNFDNIPSRRTPWQSVDVGLRIHQKWSYQAWMLTLMVVAPIFLGLRLLSIFVFDAFEHNELFGNFVIQTFVTPFAALLSIAEVDVLQGYYTAADFQYLRFLLSNIHIVFLIWFKPIYERIFMLLYSKKLFGEEMTNKELLNAFLKSLKQSVILDLTWRRLNPNRSFNNPVSILEGQKSSNRSKRIGSLSSRCGSALFFVFIALIGVEVSLLIAFVILYGMFASSYEISVVMMVLSDVFTLFTLTYIASINSAIGFSLYINQRNLLEAWDIEKSISKALLSLKQKSKFLAPALLFVVFSFSSEHLNANEADEKQEAVTSLTVEQRLIKAQSDEAFHEIKTVRVLKSKAKEEKEKKKDKKKEKEKDNKPRDPIDFNGQLIGDVFQFLVLTILALMIITVLIKYRSAIQNFTQIERKKKLETFDSGLEITKESLPTDVLSTAKRFFENNESRKGISLLYRASLSSLYYDFEIEFERSDTEQDCLKRASSIDNKELVEFFRTLTKIWINFAYGHIEITKEQQQYLIDTWPLYFRNKEAENG